MDHGSGEHRAARWACALALLGTTLGASRAGADAPPVSGFEAGAIFPIQCRTVQLDSETVDIRLNERFGFYDGDPNATCVYFLRNLTAKPESFAMAFVTGTDFNCCPAGNYQNAGFRVWQDGEERPVRMLAARGVGMGNEDKWGVEWDSLPAWRLTIGPRARSTVQMCYRATWRWGNSYEFTYFSKPAALWAGELKRASFVLHFPDTTVARRMRNWDIDAEPDGYRWVADGLRWDFRDWKPDCDLSIEIYADGRDPSRSPWSADSEAAMPEITRDVDSPAVPMEQSVCEDPRVDEDDPQQPSLPADSVRVRAHVTERGTVDQTRLPGPASDLDDGAPACVSKWKFRPATRFGQTVASWTDVVVRYAARSAGGR
jgi:hypothetical protein